jgi:chromosome transmission fidelity protein 4
VKVDGGHSAPVLSVVIDPLEEFVVSSACDGSACIWTLGGKQLQRWDRLFPTSNDISTSSTLCRPSWHPTEGKFLAVPVKDQVNVYFRDGWGQSRSFKSNNVSFNNRIKT